MSKGRGLIAAGAIGLNVIAGGAAIASWPGESEISRNGDIEKTVNPGFVEDDIAVRDMSVDLNGDGIAGDVVRQDNGVADFAKVMALGLASDALLATGLVLVSRNKD